MRVHTSLSLCSKGPNLVVVGCLLMCCAILAPSNGVKAQVAVGEGLSIVNSTSEKSVTLNPPTGLSNTITINLPSTTGSDGQTLAATSVSGNTVNLGWVTQARSFASYAGVTSADLTTTGTNAPATGDKYSISVSKSRAFRIQGFIRTGRVSAAGGSDGVVFNIEAPTGTSDIELNVRCYDCPDGTWGASGPFALFTSSTSTTLTTDVIDPGGAGGGSWGPYTYQLDGFFRVPSSGSSGDLVLWVQGSGGTNDHVLSQGSFVVITEMTNQ